jgi:hypothetical protein
MFTIGRGHGVIGCWIVLGEIDRGRERIHRWPSLLSPDVVRLVGCANKAIAGQISQAEIHAWHNMPHSFLLVSFKSLVLLR